MSFTSFMHYLYEHKYKQLLIAPVIIALICLVVIGTTFFKTGELVEKGISLKGGVSVSVQAVGQLSAEELQSDLRSQFSGADISIRELTRAGQKVGFVIEATNLEAKQIMSAVQSQIPGLSQDNFSVDTIGPSLGESFLREAVISVLIAFLLMAIIVFIYFRAVVPSFYVIFAAFLDILFALAMVDVFNVKLSTAGVAAFLMLIGYSVDTDILLTTRVLKRTEGTVVERMVGSIGTGLTMTAAAIAATVVAYFATPSETLKQIMFILFWGLIADIFNTWLTNAALLRLYMLKKGEH